MRTALRLALANPLVQFDPDTRDYIKRVEAADGAPLETQVRRAIDGFVRGCKADGIWNAIKASCIMAGARTLAGALVPLKGTAPTNYNFVSGDYDRKTGLKGDGGTKYLDSNRNNNADPQDSKSISIHITEATSLNSLGIGCSITSTSGRSGININYQSGTANFRINGASNSQASFVPTGFLGANRNSSTTLIHQAGGTASSTASTSQTPLAENIGVFATVSQLTPTNARLSFYSIGEALDLALLDARVSALMSTFTSVIP